MRLAQAWGHVSLMHAAPLPLPASNPPPRAPPRSRSIGNTVTSKRRKYHALCSPPTRLAHAIELDRLLKTGAISAYEYWQAQQFRALVEKVGRSEIRVSDCGYHTICPKSYAKLAGRWNAWERRPLPIPIAFRVRFERGL